MFHADGMCVTPVYREAAKVCRDPRARRASAPTSRTTRFALRALEKLLSIVGKDFQLEALAKQTHYILTADNFLKMLLIII